MLKNLKRMIRKKSLRNFCMNSENQHKEKYQFFEKTLAFSVTNPHFPHNAVEINVPTSMRSYIEEYLP